MKKYETPKIEVVEFETTDIIQASVVTTPQSLNKVGLNLGSTLATNIFE